MREQTTRYVGSGSFQFARFDEPRLVVSSLLRLLQLSEEAQQVAPRTRGKKRAAAPSGSTQRKRSKKDPNIATPTEEVAQVEGEQPRIPALLHSFVLHFRDDQDEIDDESAQGLRSWLRNFGLSDRFGVDDISFRYNGVDLIAYTRRDGDEYSLLRLPPIDIDFEPADYDVRGNGLQDPLVASTKLEGAGRVEMKGSFNMAALPLEEATNLGVLPFEIRLIVSINLVQPAIFEPFIHSSKVHHSEIEEAQRRFGLFAFSPSSPPPDSFQGQIDISLLYSILRPAPLLPSRNLEDLLQPRSLLPSLLPFQRRSVAKMLSQEGKVLSDSGAVVPREQDDNSLPIFWQHVKVAGDVDLYFNRITGMLSTKLPKEKHPTLGGILAEEPGLGKTLECIALILLNPSIGRNPTIKTWDPSAKIHVREIKTTLIVTPPALAPQWADEIALHSPGLRVFIYEGWAKVPVPISEADAAHVREESAKAKARERARGARAALAKSPKVGTSKPKRGQKAAPSRKKENQRAESIDVDEATESSDSREDQVVDWCTFINDFDVCITTYNVLQQDLGVARPPPERPRRDGVEYLNLKRSRSPLIMCEWYRVIMDEVQMAGGGKTEEMVSLIPRVSSFAVSGTPARAQVADLVHVLRFLRIEGVVTPARVWLRLLKPGYVNEFVSLFQHYTIRTTKASVKDELTIPRQTRFLVPIELGRIERHVYDQSFEAALLDLGLDARGVAVNEDWEVDTGTLRTWLRKLRGICTHPQVGQLQNHVDRLHKPGVLKSIGEVLEGMSDQNWRNFMEDRKNKIQITATQVQLLQHDDGNRNRYQAALQLLLGAEKEAKALIADVRRALAEHNAAGKALIAKVAQSQGQGEPDDVEMEFEDNVHSHDKGKGKAQEDTQSEAAESEDSDIPKNPAGEEHGIKKRALLARLRECQIALHKVCFLKGDVYHVLGNSHTNAEGEAYAEAEELRRVLLRSTEEAAKRAMNQLIHDASTKGITEKELMIKVPYCTQGGIKSHELMDEANEIIDEILNNQSALLWKWRSHMVVLLTQSLTSTEDADGQEYNRSLDTQGEAEAYLQAYAALLADRRESMTTERTLLAAHAVKETKARKTKAAAKATAFLLEEEEIMKVDGIDVQPEHQVLQKELSDERKAILEGYDSTRAIRSVMVDLNNVAAKIMREDDPEKLIAKEGASDLRRLMVEQGRVMDKLQADFALFRKAFNDRISYFRQLQELSDTVAEATWEGSVTEAIAKAETERADLDVKINTGRARQRYLEHLAKSQEDEVTSHNGASVPGSSRPYSQCPQSAHVFCEGCMKAWLARKEGKACPVCRVVIDSDQLQRFAVAEEKSKPPPTFKNNEPTPRSRRKIEYNTIDPDLFESIEMMESSGSYGSKIQTLIRHLLYLQASDYGSKSIIFSAWADSLHIIEHALVMNGISCLRVDKNTSKKNAAKKFRDDPTILVLLLHGERENAGLNVTCASRVFLVESVVNHTFEVQGALVFGSCIESCLTIRYPAIARIDRMGQSRPTEVYCYFAEETVERHILDLAARQGKSLYTKENAAGTLNANQITINSDQKIIDSPTKKRGVQKGDFVFKMDDMMAIFFPHLVEDIEYLIPAEELGLETGGSQPSQELDLPAPSRTRSQPRHENAVAGPSRLR